MFNFLICCVVFCQFVHVYSGGVVSQKSAPVSPSKSEVEPIAPKLLSSISIFGTSSRNENIEKALKDFHNDKAFKALTNPIELYQSLSTVFVGVFNEFDLRYNSNQVEAYIESYLENVLSSKSSKELVIVYEVKPDQTQSSIDKSMAYINSIYNTMLNDLVAAGEISAANCQLSVVSIVREASRSDVLSSLGDSVLSRIKEKETDSSTVSSTVYPTITTTTVQLLKENDDSILLSPAGYEDIEMQFVLDFSVSLSEITNSSVIPLDDKTDKFITASVITENNLNYALERAIQKSYESYPDFFSNSYQNSYSVLLLSYRIRMRINQVLQKLYRKAIDNMKQSTLDLFEVNSRKTPTDSKYLKRLQKKANILLDSFHSNCEVVTHAVKSMIQKTTMGDGMYNLVLFNKLKSSFLFQDSAVFQNKFTYSFDSISLKSQLMKSCHEKVCNGIITGRYNPFVRDYPFPPLTLKFNYLFDPRSMLYSMSYEQLYDEHKEGFANNRAAPLLVPGMALLPFNPNELPVAKENKAWWKILKDFFNNEL